MALKLTFLIVSSIIAVWNIGALAKEGNLKQGKESVKVAQLDPYGQGKNESVLGESNLKDPLPANRTKANIRKKRNKRSSEESTTASAATGTTAFSTEPSSTTPAAVCEWGDWETWSKCDCRTGVQTRIRNPKVLPSKHCTVGGCAGKSRACTRSRCPIDCVYSKWSSWSVCNGPCGDGIRRRYRRVRVPALYGGKKCKRFVEEDHCVIHGPGCGTDCEVGQWSSWSPCHHANPYETCGECYGYAQPAEVLGFQDRERIVVGHHGHSCPELREKQQCHLSCC